jgi:AcrR family transcriptional regulator
MPESDPRKRIREAKTAMYSEVILEAAEQVFGEHGFEAARVQDIARAAGVSLSTLYGVFPGKSELFAAIHEKRGAELMEMSARLAGRSEGVLELLLAGIAAYFDFHIRRPDYLRMNVSEGQAWPTGSQLRSREQAEAWSWGFDMLTRAFEQGISEGIFTDDDPPDLMARTLLATHVVRLADWVNRDACEPPELMIRRVQRQFVRTFCTPEVAPTMLERLSEGPGFATAAGAAS